MTYVLRYDMLNTNMVILSISESASEGQALDPVTSRTDGLRILAKIIARHILADSWGKTTSGVDKKSMASHCRRNGSENIR